MRADTAGVGVSRGTSCICAMHSCQGCLCGKERMSCDAAVAASHEEAGLQTFGHWEANAEHPRAALL